LRLLANADTPRHPKYIVDTVRHFPLEEAHDGNASPPQVAARATEVGNVRSYRALAAGTLPCPGKRPGRPPDVVYLPHHPISEGIMQTVKPESVGLSSARLEGLKSTMQQYVDRGTFGGIVSLIARKEKVAHLEAFGWQELETRRPITTDTIFQIYSITKPITSTAVMILCEEGKIRLADPVSRYIPEFKDARVMVACPDGDSDLVPARREMTIHDLLTNSGGLSYGSEEHSALDMLYRKTFERQDKEMEPVLEKRILDLARTQLPLAFHPGTDFRYSISIDVLGYIV